MTKPDTTKVIDTINGLRIRTLQAKIEVLKSIYELRTVRIYPNGSSEFVINANQVKTTFLELEKKLQDLA